MVVLYSYLRFVHIVVFNNLIDNNNYNEFILCTNSMVTAFLGLYKMFKFLGYNGCLFKPIPSLDNF